MEKDPEGDWIVALMIPVVLLMAYLIITGYTFWGFFVAVAGPFVVMFVAKHLGGYRIDR